jgi:microcystin-dependent protein
MSSPFIGEIRMVGFNFAPVNWASCNGAIQSIAENNALFALIGTTYGGDGQQTFALPNLQGCVPVHQGTNPTNGIAYTIGEYTGVENVTLITQQIPAHSHPVPCAVSGNASSPANAVFGGDPTTAVYANADGSTQLNNAFLSITGNNQPHSNMMPYQAVNFIISLFGIFPSQN